MSSRLGLFITLEGGEGVGKSTLCKALAARLEAAGHTVLTSREPGGSPGAEAIRKLVLHTVDNEAWSARAEALLMAAARAEHVDRTLRPALHSGATVVCDRFLDSTWAYQGVGSEWTDAQLDQLAELTLGAQRPDITLLLDGPPEAFLVRRVQRGGAADGFERRGMDFHRAVRARFLQIAQREPARMVVLDATQDQRAVLDAAWDAIQAHPAWQRRTHLE
jgi:dTMP kinase